MNTLAASICVYSLIVAALFLDGCMQHHTETAAKITEALHVEQTAAVQSEQHEQIDRDEVTTAPVSVVDVREEDEPPSPAHPAGLHVKETKTTTLAPVAQLHETKHTDDAQAAKTAATGVVDFDEVVRNESDDKPAANWPLRILLALLSVGGAAFAVYRFVSSSSISAALAIGKGAISWLLH